MIERQKETIIESDNEDRWEFHFTSYFLLLDIFKNHVKLMNIELSIACDIKYVFLIYKNNPFIKN